MAQLPPGYLPLVNPVLPVIQAPAAPQQALAILQQPLAQHSQPITHAVTTTQSHAVSATALAIIHPPRQLKFEYNSPATFKEVEQNLVDFCFKDILETGAVSKIVLDKLTEQKAKKNCKYDKIEGTNAPKILGLALFFCDQGIRVSIINGIINKNNCFVYYKNFIKKNDQFNFELFLDLIRSTFTHHHTYEKIWAFSNLMIALLPKSDINLLMKPMGFIFSALQEYKCPYLEAIQALSPEHLELIGKHLYLFSGYASFKEGFTEINCNMPEIYLDLIKYCEIPIVYDLSGIGFIYREDTPQETLSESSASTTGKRSRNEDTGSLKISRLNQEAISFNEKLIIILNNLKNTSKTERIDISQFRGLNFLLIIDALKKFSNLKEIKINALSEGIECLAELNLTKIEFVIPSDAKASPIALKVFKTLFSHLFLNLTVEYDRDGDWTFNDRLPFIVSSAPHCFEMINTLEEITLLHQKMPNLETLILGKTDFDLPFIPSLRRIILEEISDDAFTKLIETYSSSPDIDIGEDNQFYPLFFKNPCNSTSNKACIALNNRLAKIDIYPNIIIDEETLKNLYETLTLNPRLCYIAKFLLVNFFYKNASTLHFGIILRSIQLNLEDKKYSGSIRDLIIAIQSVEIFNFSKIHFPLLNLICQQSDVTIEMVEQALEFLSAQEYNYCDYLTCILASCIKNNLTLPFNSLKQISALYIKLSNTPEYNLNLGEQFPFYLFDNLLNTKQSCDEFVYLLKYMLIHLTENAQQHIHRVISSSLHRPVCLQLLKNDSKDVVKHPNLIKEVFISLSKLEVLSDDELKEMENFLQPCLAKFSDLALVINSPGLALKLGKILAEQIEFPENNIHLNVIIGLIRFGCDESLIIKLFLKLNGKPIIDNSIIQDFLVKPSVSKAILTHLDATPSLYPIFRNQLKSIIQSALLNISDENDKTLIFNSIMNSPSEVILTGESTPDIVSMLLDKIEKNIRAKYRNLRIRDVLQYIVNSNVPLTEIDQSKFYEIKRASQIEICSGITESTVFLRNHPHYFKPWIVFLKTTLGATHRLNTISLVNIIEMLIHNYNANPNDGLLLEDIRVFSEHLFALPDYIFTIDQIKRLLPILNTTILPDKVYYLVFFSIARCRESLHRIETPEEVDQLCKFTKLIHDRKDEDTLVSKFYEKFVWCAMAKIEVIRYLIINCQVLPNYLVRMATSFNLLEDEECRPVIMKWMKENESEIKFVTLFIADKSIKILLKDASFKTHFPERANLMTLSPLCFELPPAIQGDKEIELTEGESQVNVKKLITLFEAVNIENASQPGYINPKVFEIPNLTKAQLISKVKAFVDEVIIKKPITGAPKEDKIAAFFDQIEKIIKILITRLEALDPSSREFYYIELINGFFRCGTAKMFAVSNCYTLMTSKPLDTETVSPRDRLITHCYQQRFSAFESAWQLFKRSNTIPPNMEVHWYYKLFELAAGDLSIKTLVPYEDTYVNFPKDYERAFMRFVGRFMSPVQLVKSVISDKRLFTNTEITSMLTDYYSKKLYPDLMVVEGEPLEKVREAVLDAIDLDTGKLTIDGGTDLLSGLGVLLG